MSIFIYYLFMSIHFSMIYLRLGKKSSWGRIKKLSLGNRPPSECCIIFAFLLFFKLLNICICCSINRKLYLLLFQYTIIAFQIWFSLIDCNNKQNQRHVYMVKVFPVVLVRRSTVHTFCCVIIIYCYLSSHLQIN